MPRSPHSETDPSKGEVQKVKRTNAASAGITRPAGVPTSAFDLGRQAKGGSRGPRGPRLFDVSAVPVEAGVALPPKVGGIGGVSQYALLAQRMKPGDVAWLDQRRAYGLKVWFRKAGGAAEVRKLPDGRFGCWLLAVPPAASNGKARKR
jgi:hypothetical protein